ncbi:hypothetical protein RKE29_01985 [Streptomyces sp. B1866]|uniref:phage tail protein n=1 Tax=Streptomyces sp. B1866 TaxID=3075431 RepID=UPI00288D948A|nr:hypothetical protein [Streptomyces sp. B1866]MDT3395430.1 hypothetical protein [Streptomyces sp. B1866]
MSTLASMTVRLGIDTDRLRAGAARARGILTGLGKAAAGLGIGAPAAAATTAAVGGMAAAFASAGIAAKAFQLAAGPQLKAVSEVADLAAEAQKAAAEGAEDAADKQKAYEAALKRLPPATRATAKEFVGLKGDFQKWSDSLSGTTMPVFTKGLQLLRSLLPALTPLVKAAAGALDDFLDGVQDSVDKGSVTDFAEDLAGSAEKNLGSFLRSLRNVVTGFGGIIRAFLPLSDNMSGGIEESTAAFARWGQGLEGSRGFEQFLDIAREGAKTLGTLGSAAVELLVALAPVIGVTSQLVLWFARLINNTPQPVLRALAVTLTVVAVATRLYAAYQIAATVATRAWAVAQLVLNAAFWTSPITWIVAGIVALIAVIILIGTKTTWFQTAWNAAWGGIKRGTDAAVGGVLTAVGWLAALPGRIAGWFGQGKDWAVQKWQQLLTWVRGFPGRAVGALSTLGGRLASTVGDAGRQMVSAVRSKITDAVNWLSGLPGRAARAIGDLGGLLYGAGRALLQGFIDGIVSKVSDVLGTVGSVVGRVRDFFGFSPAKVGPLSGKGWTLYSGHALAEDFAAGITARQDAVYAAVSDATATAAGAMPTVATPRGVAAAASGQAPVRVLFDVTGANEDMKKMVRKMVRVDGRGKPQTAFAR